MMAQALLVRRLAFDRRIRAVAKGRARTVHSLKCIAFMVQKTNAAPAGGLPAPTTNSWITVATRRPKEIITILELLVQSRGGTVIRRN